MSHEFLADMPPSTIEAMQAAGNRRAYLGYFETVSDPVDYGTFIRTLAGLKGKPPTTNKTNPKGGKR